MEGKRGGTKKGIKGQEKNTERRQYKIKKFVKVFEVSQQRPNNRETGDERRSVTCISGRYLVPPQGMTEVEVSE